MVLHQAGMADRDRLMAWSLVQTLRTGHALLAKKKGTIVTIGGIPYLLLLVLAAIHYDTDNDWACPVVNHE